MTKLSTRLPKEYDDNGLESNQRKLIGAYTSQEYIPVVGLIRTKEILSDEDFTKIPKVELVVIELGVDDEDGEAIRELIQMLHDKRVAHIRQPLDLPDTEEPPLAPILELETSDGMYSVIVVDEDKRKFTLVLVAPSGAKVTERHALPRKDYGELEPGNYPLSALTGDALELAQALIQDYEQGFAVVDEGDVLDAELVDESTTTDTTQED